MLIQSRAGYDVVISAGALLTVGTDATGLGDTDLTGLAGVGILLPSAPYGQRIDAIMASVSGAFNNPLIPRVFVLSGGMSIDGLQGVVATLPQQVATRVQNAAGPPGDGQRLEVSDIENPTIIGIGGAVTNNKNIGLTCRLDFYLHEFTETQAACRPITFGPNGLFIPPGENAIVVLAGVVDHSGAGILTPSIAGNGRMSVHGAAISKAEAKMMGSDLGRAPARFFNMEVPPVK